jgi:Na+/melibiose symporter-like transporter
MGSAELTGRYIDAMGAVMFMSLGILFLMSIPIITSRFAKRMGRDPRIWFLIGIILPVIATVILVFLPDLSEKN